MLTHINNQLALPASLLVQQGWLTESNLKKMIYVSRKLEVLQRGGGKGTELQLSYASAPEVIKQKVRELLGYDPMLVAPQSVLERMIEPDAAAYSFFALYTTKLGRGLDGAVQTQYTCEAQILNAVRERLARSGGKAMNKGRSKGISQQTVLDEVHALPMDKYKHKLPADRVAFFRKYGRYLDEGYESLVSGKYSVQNAQKIDQYIERVLIALYCMPELPFVQTTADMYLAFLANQFDIVDTTTGELFDRDLCRDADGEFVTLSTAAIWNRINQPAIRMVVDAARMNEIDFNTKRSPFNHRHAAVFSDSKISMDDRTLSRKDSLGRWLNAYVVYEPVSGCFLACVVSFDKPSLDMIYACFRDLYLTCMEHELNWPSEVEVEQHLFSDIKDEVAQLFPYLRYCRGGNSKEKRAEHGIRQLKYQIEKRNHEGVGRWYSKADGYGVKSKHKDPELKEIRVDQRELIADVYRDIEQNNAAPHPKHPGKTRWQVLVEKQNPDGARPLPSKLFRYIGEWTQTSIRNNDFCRVQYADYEIETYEILKRLKPNDYTVDAYYVRNRDGSIPSVVLYQGEQYLGRATKIQTYNEAQAEQNDDDRAIMQHQFGRKSEFTALVRKGKKAVGKAAKIAPTPECEPVAEIVETRCIASVPQPEPEFTWTAEFDAGDAFDSL